MEGRRISLNKYLENINICFRFTPQEGKPHAAVCDMVDRTTSLGSLSSIIWSSVVRGDQFSTHLHGGVNFFVRLCHCVCFIMKTKVSNSQLFKTILDPWEGVKFPPPPSSERSLRALSPPLPVVRVSVHTWLSSARPARALSHLLLMTVESSLWHLEKRPPRTWVRLPLLSLFNNDLSD